MFWNPVQHLLVENALPREGLLLQVADLLVGEGEASLEVCVPRNLHIGQPVAHGQPVLCAVRGSSSGYRSVWAAHWDSGVATAG